MDYAAHYEALILKAAGEAPKREQFNKAFPGLLFEWHHILPTAEGGTDEPFNLILLTIKEHYCAHLLLSKMGFPNQILSVECFLKDSINVRSPRFGMFRWKRWLRRNIAYQRAKNIRLQGKLKAIAQHTTQLMILNHDYELKLKAIEERYASNLLKAAFDELE